MFKKLSLLSIGIVLAFTMSACGKKTPAPAASSSNSPVNTASEPNNSTVPDASLVAQTVYKQNCVSCHGVELAGGVGPNLQKVGTRLSDQQIATTITNGRGVMPTFKDKLKAEEIDALSAWLSSKK